MTLMTVPMKGATHSTRGPSGPTPAAWNRELATLRAAVRWWRRRERVDRTRALTRGQLKRPMSVQKVRCWTTDLGGGSCRPTGRLWPRSSLAPSRDRWRGKTQERIERHRVGREEEVERQQRRDRAAEVLAEVSAILRILEMEEQSVVQRSGEEYAREPRDELEALEARSQEQAPSSLRWRSGSRLPRCVASPGSWSAP